MSESAVSWEIQHCHNVQCVRHLHMEAEFVVVTEGVLHVLTSSGETILGKGESLYLMPLDIHGYYTETASECTILIFPTDLVPDFAVIYPTLRPFFLAGPLLETLKSLEPDKDYSLLRARAVLYPLCCAILDNCPYEEEIYIEVPSVSRVEKYIWDNLSSPLSLASVAASTGFNPSYLSRMFHQSKGVGFLEYINMLRCYQAIRLMYSSKTMTISEIAYQVGFESIRTFNRVFHQRYGITPSQMKHEQAASIPKR